MPVLGAWACSGVEMANYLRLQGCPVSARIGTLGRAPTGVEVPTNRNSPSCSHACRQEAVSQRGNCLLSSSDLVCHMLNVMG